jgi:hypothetical protein
VRERVLEGERESAEQGTFLSTIVLVGGTVFVALALAAIAITDGIRTMSDDTYHHRVYSGVVHAASDAGYLLVVTSGAGMAAFILATTLAIRRFAILPRWVGWLGFAAAVCAIFSLFFFTMLVWLLWLAVAAVSLFLSSRTAATRAPEPAPAS